MNPLRSERKRVLTQEAGGSPGGLKVHALVNITENNTSKVTQLCNKTACKICSSCTNRHTVFQLYGRASLVQCGCWYAVCVVDIRIAILE